MTLHLGAPIFGGMCTDHNDLIDCLGGTTSVAKLLGIRPPSVHEWRTKGIPRGRLIELAPLVEKAPGSRWTRWNLFPDDWWKVWPELIGTEGAPDVPERVA